VLSQGGHKTRLHCPEIHFNNLTRIGADNRLALAIATIGIKNYGRNHEIKAKRNNSSHE